MNRFRFVRIREVLPPSRGNKGDAGLDFYVPTDLSLDLMVEVNNAAAKDLIITSEDIDYSSIDSAALVFKVGSNNLVNKIIITPKARVIIPSGIKCLLEPENSMLMAANKSGVSTKKGLIYTAEIVDSTYTGEMHICLVNTSSKEVEIEAGSKIMQFIHVPVYLTEPEEISKEDFCSELKTHVTNRGDKWQGSTDNK